MVFEIRSVIFHNSEGLVVPPVQLFPAGSGRFRFGSELPIILGISFAYLPSMQAIVEAGGNVATIMAVLLNIILPPEEEA